MTPAYLRDVPSLSTRQLWEARQAERENPSELAPRVARLAKMIRRRRPQNFAWQDSRENPFGPLPTELAEAITSHFRAGIEARVTARDMGISIKTIRVYYRRLAAAGVQRDRGPTIHSMRLFMAVDSQQRHGRGVADDESGSNAASLIDRAA